MHCDIPRPQDRSYNVGWVSSFRRIREFSWRSGGGVGVGTSTGGTIRVRRAGPEDAGVLLQLWSGLVVYHKTIEHVRPQRWSGEAGEVLRGLLAQVWTDPDRQAVFIAEVGGIAAGFVRLSLSETGPCPARIETLFVLEAMRRQRVGARLLDTAYAWFRDRGAPEVSVDFLAPNQQARDFYEHSGFQPLLETYIRRL